MKMIDEVRSYGEYQELQRMKTSLTVQGFRFCDILLSWLECDHYKRHWDGLHDRWVTCESFKQFMECSPPAGLGLGDKAKEEIEILKRGGVPGAERILAAWYSAQPLPVDDQEVQPRNPHGRKGKESIDNVNRLKGGNDTTYTLRRLARDAPEILAKVQSGELSVNAAAIAAGIRKKPSHNDTALKAFRRSQDRVGLLRDILSAFITEGGQQSLYEVQAMIEGLRRESPKEKATNGVRIDSGPLEATDKFEQVPKDKWFFLMLAKRDFLARRVAYDCRCLVEFCEEAELVYNDCGFTSAAEMIQHGYELDPVEIELAVAWLKHNQPKDNQPCD